MNGKDDRQLPKRRLAIGLIIVAIFVGILLIYLNSSNERNMDSIVKEPNFAGIVEDISETSILLRVNEDEEEIRSSDLISVSLDVEIEESTLDFNIGDEVRVYYDGMIAESYPAQINNVYAIILEQ